MSLKFESYETVAEASAAVEDGDESVQYHGGGSLLVRRVNEGDLSISTMVRSTDPSLKAIEIADNQVILGASVTMAEVMRHPELGFLNYVVRSIGGPAVRNMATVGGNLFAPTPYGDFTVGLLALDAKLVVDGDEVSVEEFLAEREGKYAGKIVKSISFDVPSAGRFRFLKATRVRPRGTSIVSIAAVLEHADGTISAARIGFGCMSDRPIRAKAVEAALLGQALDEEGIAPALAVALEGTDPVTDSIASAWYRSKVLPIHLRRLLLDNE